MEIIKKRVNLRDFTEKFGKEEPYLIPIGEVAPLSGTSFGKIPYNVKITESTPASVVAILPHFNTGTYQGIKFGTIANYYVWLRKFIMDSRYYMPGKRRTEYTWTEVGADLNFIESGTTLQPLEGKLVLFELSEGVYDTLPENAEDFECEKDIVCINESAAEFLELFSSQTSAVEFFNYVEGTIFTGQYDSAATFLEVPVLIDSDLANMGDEYFCQPETYSAGTEYSTGAFVTDDDGYVYKSKEDSNINNKPSTSPEYWEKLVISDGHTVASVRYFVESQLDTLRRRKTTVDISGNSLDFVYDEGDTELPYDIVGATPQSIVYDTKMSAYTCNRMAWFKPVTCYQLDGTEMVGFPLVYDVDEHSSLVGTKGRVRFSYIVGCLFESATITPTALGYNGLNYQEEYDFEIVREEFYIDSKEVATPVIYMKIDYTTGLKPEWAEVGKRYALVSIDSPGEELLSANTFIRKDTLIGVTDVNFTTSKIKIERGASACYEAFNVIGEVNSISDIEKYHDDWFRIKGKND